MRFLSLFSGIEAASQAWIPLGWEAAAVAENEPFPCAVLKHHYLDVPNLGDVSKVTEAEIIALGRIDLIVGGFPCQDLSVAGKRKGLKHDDGSNTRSGLFFDAMRLVRWARKHCGLRWLVIENVPGLYSSHRGRDFAAVVEQMVGARFGVPRDGWKSSGAAVGPEGFVEWASLDAQFWGLAQRRKRVFFVCDFGDWKRRGPILLERESLQWNPPPSREAGKDVARPVASCAPGGSGYRNDADTAENLIAETLREHPRPGSNSLGAIAFGGNNTAGPIDLATAVNAHGGPHGCLDFESETFIGTTSAPITSNPYGDHESRETLLVAHSLRADGFDASEDGTGLGTPIVPVSFDPQGVGKQTTLGYSDDGLTGALGATKTPAICFSSKDHGADAESDLSPTLRAGVHDRSHANAGVPPAVAYALGSHAGAADGDQTNRSHDKGGPVGSNISEDVAYSVRSERTQAVSFALRGRGGGAMPEVHDQVSALRSASGGSTRDYVAVGLSPETMYGVSHADAAQTGPDQALRALRLAVGEEAFSQWGLGVHAAFRAAEILRSEVHGIGVRCSPDDRHELGDHPLPRQKNRSEGAVLALWRSGCPGRSPRGWRPSEQLAIELVSHLSELPHQGTPSARFMLGLWRASEGIRTLRQALSADEDARRSAAFQTQPAHPLSVVRRLTPKEAARLQGFPDSYLDITFRCRPAADGNKYRALGNSMAVPVMAWIGRRIQMVDNLPD